MGLKQLLPRTELPLRNRTLHAARFRKGSKNVDAKARNIPKRKYVLDPACVNESNIEVYRRMYSVSYINVQSLKFIETRSNGRYILVKRGTSL
jgi:hypothetical protein